MVPTQTWILTRPQSSWGFARTRALVVTAHLRWRDSADLEMQNKPHISTTPIHHVGTFIHPHSIHGYRTWPWHTERNVSRNFHLPDFQISALFNTDNIWFRRKFCPNPLAQLAVLLALGHEAVVCVKPRMQGLLVLLWVVYTTSTGPDVGLVQQQASTSRPKTHKRYDVCQHQPWQQAMHAWSIAMLPWTLSKAL